MRWSLIPLLLLGACAQPLAPAATTWIGRSEADLVGALGVPNRLYDAEGRRFLAYDGQGSAPSGPRVVPSIGFGVGRWSGGWGSGVGVGTGIGLGFGGYGDVTQPCTTTYEVRDGQVIGANRQGPGCG